MIMAVHLHLKSITVLFFFLSLAYNIYNIFLIIYENLHTYVLCARGEYKKEKNNVRVSCVNKTSVSPRTRVVSRSAAHANA